MFSLNAPFYLASNHAHEMCKRSLEAALEKIEMLEKSFAECEQEIDQALEFLGPINYHIKDDHAGKHIKHYLDCATARLEKVVNYHD